jgi:branched-chain amino acid aminotransferase
MTGPGDRLAPAGRPGVQSTPVMATTPRHVWVDGRIVEATEPVLTVFDRGFQLGDGVFETLRARAGRPTELAEHAARLRRSADGLGIPLPADIEGTLAAAIDELLGAEGLDGTDGDASIRVTVSRGAILGRGLLPPDEHPAPTVVVQAWPVAPPPAAHLEIGLHLVPSAIRRDPENPLSALKTTSRADYVHARIEARAAGADDALFLTIDGYLSEATSANVFLVRESRLATPSLRCAILPGTTRDWILRWAAAVGLSPEEGLLTVRDLAEADEAFLSSSVAGILPVTRFAGSPIGDGRPGPWALRARGDREAFIRGETP